MDGLATDKFVTPAQLEQVSQAEKNYIDNVKKELGEDIKDIEVPEAADEGDITKITDLFKVEDTD